MAIAHIVPGDANARQKTNQAFDELAAVQSDLVTEANARNAADVAEAAARTLAIAQAPMHHGIQHRPGQSPSLFTSSIAALPGSVDGLDPAGVVPGDDGPAYRITGAGLVTTRPIFALEPNRRYAAGFAAIRRTATNDPANDAVRFALAWYDQAGAYLSSTVVADLVDISENAGRQQTEVTVARIEALGAQILAPALARGVRPYVQAYGGPAQNDVLTLRLDDVSDIIAVSASVADMTARMAGLAGFVERDDGTLVFRDSNGSVILLMGANGVTVPGGTRLVATDTGTALVSNDGRMLFEAFRSGGFGDGAAVRFIANGLDQIRVIDDAGFVLSYLGEDNAGSTPAAAAVRRAWSGACTDTSFTLAADIEGDGLVLVELATDAAFSTIIASRVTAPALTGAYRCFKTAFSGLTANTVHHWRITPNGRADAAATGRVKTFPAAGAANAAYSFVFGSCANVDGTRAAPVFDAIRVTEADCLFVGHLGDHPYADVAVDVIDETRMQLRRFRDCASVTRMHAALPMISMRSDHDYAWNDTTWDSVASSGATHVQICANTRQVDRESAPLHPCYPEATGEQVASRQTQAQVFSVGPDRHIILDTYTQSRYLSGTPTCLGNGTNPPGSWDQLGWFKAQLLQAKTDACRHIFVWTGRSWNYSANETWSQRYLVEATEICNFLDANAINNVVLLEGDQHRSVADDGTNTDFSTSGGLTIRRFMSSPYMMVMGGSDIPAQWGANAAARAPLSYTGERLYEISQYARINVLANGHIEFVVKGAPYDAVTYAPTALATFSTAAL